jgi:hypothetical protein
MGGPSKIPFLVKSAVTLVDGGLGVRKVPGAGAQAEEERAAGGSLARMARS